MYEIKIYQEEAIPWELQNQIHRLLNIAFKGRSIKFIAKTYANVPPIARVLCFRDGELVAHTGISQDVMRVGNISLRVGCLGLTASISHNKGLATSALKAGADYLKEQGFALAIGISNSPVMLKYIIPTLRSIIVDVRLKGKNTISKPDDQTAFFGLTMNDENLQQLANEAIKAGIVLIDGEVF